MASWCWCWCWTVMVAHSLSSCVRLARTPCCNAGRNGESIGGRRAWGAGRDGESMVAGSSLEEQPRRSHSTAADAMDTMGARGLRGSGVLVMFRRGDGDGGGKRSWKVNCSQLGPGRLVGLLGSGLARRRQKTKRQGRVWPTLALTGQAWFSSFTVQRFPTPGPRRPREAKQEGGGDHYRTHQLKRRDPLAIQPASRSHFWRLGRPKHELHLTKTPPAVIQLSPPRQVLFVKGGVISGRGIRTRKNHKRQGHSTRQA